jgi:hypothetical protein
VADLHSQPGGVIQHQHAALAAENAALIAENARLREAAAKAASWLSTRGTHYAGLGSESVARGLFEQAHALETALTPPAETSR